MTITTTADGSPTIFSEKFGVTYHSKFGAITESRHVFVDAGLRYQAVRGRKIDLLEVGFGTGLNAFLSLVEATKRNLEIKYTALEPHPISEEFWQSLNYPTLLQLPDYQNVFEKMHTDCFDKKYQLTDHFSFEKKQLPAEKMDFKNAFDLIFFDAFSPASQPELWSENVLKKMFDSLRPDGILVTYCAQGHFKRTLKTVGFGVESLPGPPGKREMTRAFIKN